MGFYVTSRWARSKREQTRLLLPHTIDLQTEKKPAPDERLIVTCWTR